MVLVLGWGALTGGTFQGGLRETFRRGAPAPEFDVVDLDGNRLNLKGLRGKVVVLNFWFIACPPCRVEIPQLNQLVGSFQGKDVVFIAFAPDSPPELREFLDSHTFRYAVVPDATPIAEKFGIHGAPTHVLIDREGNYAKALFGAVEDLDSELRRPIEALLK